MICLDRQPSLTINYAYDALHTHVVRSNALGMVKQKPAYNSVPEHVLNRIRVERLAQGLSLEELAERIDKSWQMLQKYETGKVPVTLDTLAKVASALNRPLACLVKGGSALSESEADLIELVRANPQDAVVVRSTLRGLQEARRNEGEHS